MGGGWTKGEWKIDGSSQPDSPPAIVIATQDAVIAEVFGENSADEPETVANARLISAAPELFTYLEIALGIIEKSKIIWMGADGARAALSLAHPNRDG